MVANLFRERDVSEGATLMHILKKKENNKLVDNTKTFIQMYSSDYSTVDPEDSTEWGCGIVQ